MEDKTVWGPLWPSRCNLFRLKGNPFNPRHYFSTVPIPFFKSVAIRLWFFAEFRYTPFIAATTAGAGAQRRGGPSGEPHATLKVAAGGSRAGRRAQDGGAGRPAFPRPAGGDFRRERERASVPW